MRKIYVILLVTILLISMAIPAHAALPDPPVTPQYDYIETCRVGLSINESSGIANCTASCYVATNNKVEIEYKLQKYMGSYWATVKTWTTSATSYVSLSQSWAVYSGYTYRGYATCRVYDSAGNLLETGSVSKTYSYPSN